MNRKIYFRKLPSTELAMGERTLIMGILNVTPDSFSDGGRFHEPERALARALEMEREGADLIDLGAESTRPDSKRISADEEWRRLLPVLKLLKGRLTVPLSLDTYKSEIAERAVQFGVDIINDPSGLTFDANLAKVAAEHNLGLILNHMRGTPETWGKQPAMTDAMDLVSRDLEATVSRARRAGVEKDRIIIDPGLGFGKRKEQNSELISQLGRLAELDYPILAGPSRKSFLGQVLKGEAGEAETAFATAAAVTAAILYGAHMVRVHDVKEMRAAALVADEILRVSAAHKAAVDAAAEVVDQRPVLRPRRVDVPFLTGERAIPTRPPLARPAFVPPPVEPVPARPSGEDAIAFLAHELKDADLARAELKDTEPKPADAAVEKPADPAPPESPAQAAAPPAPPVADAKPAEPPAPKKFDGQRPILRRPAADRPPRRDSDRPARPFGARPPRPFGDRPPRRDGARPAGDRPPRPFGDRPPRPFGGRPRPFGDRPPRRDGDRPASDRPQRPFGDRPRPFGDRPPRRGGDRPEGDRPAGDRPARPFGDKPRGDGPPRGGSGRPGGKPPRPFRKRP